MAAMLGTTRAGRRAPGRGARDGDAAHEHPARHRRGPRRWAAATSRRRRSRASAATCAPAAREALLRDQIARADALYDEGVAGIAPLRRGRLRDRRGGRDVPRDPAPDRARGLRRARRARGGAGAAQAARGRAAGARDAAGREACSSPSRMSPSRALLGRLVAAQVAYPQAVRGARARCATAPRAASSRSCSPTSVAEAAQARGARRAAALPGSRRRSRFAAELAGVAHRAAVRATTATATARARGSRGVPLLAGGGLGADGAAGVGRSRGLLTRRPAPRVAARGRRPDRLGRLPRPAHGRATATGPGTRPGRYEGIPASNFAGLAGDGRRAVRGVGARSTATDDPRRPGDGALRALRLDVGRRDGRATSLFWRRPRVAVAGGAGDGRVRGAGAAARACAAADEGRRRRRRRRAAWPRAVRLAAAGHAVVGARAGATRPAGRPGALERDGGFRLDTGPSLLTMPWVVRGPLRRDGRAGRGGELELRARRARHPLPLRGRHDAGDERRPAARRSRRSRRGRRARAPTGCASSARARAMWRAVGARPGRAAAVAAAPAGAPATGPGPARPRPRPALADAARPGPRDVPRPAAADGRRALRDLRRAPTRAARRRRWPSPATSSTPSAPGTCAAACTRIVDGAGAAAGRAGRRRCGSASAVAALVRARRPRRPPW